MLTAKPKLYIPRKTFTKMMYWIDKAPGEIGGMGTITYVENGNYFWVRDVFLLEQEVTSGTTELNAIALGKLEAEIIKNKIEGDLNFWWHSHVDFGVFWSGTDTDTIKQIGEQGYCVATVLNKKREMRSAVYSKVSTDYGQESTQMTDEIPTIIHDDQPTQAMKNQWDKDYDERVKEKKYNNPAARSFDHFDDFDEEDYEKTYNKTIKAISSKDWKTPLPYKVRLVLAEWHRLNKDKQPLTEIDKDNILAASCMGMNLAYLNCFNDVVSKEQWIMLDGFIDHFNREWPAFDWKVL